MEPGDIIYWKFSHNDKVGLNGIIIENENRELFVLISTGSGYNDCDRNYSPSAGTNLTRGPRLLRLFQYNPASGAYTTDLPLLADKFYFQLGNPYTGFDSPDRGILVDYGVIRIVPYYRGIGATQPAYFGIPGCTYTARIDNIYMDFSVYSNAAGQKDVSSYIEGLYSETSTNCPAIAANIHAFILHSSSVGNTSYRAEYLPGAGTVSIPNSPRDKAEFFASLINHKIVGTLIIKRTDIPTGPFAWTLTANMILTPIE